MKEQFSRKIPVLILVGLLLLLAAQIYFINGFVQLQNLEFNKSINRTLEYAVKKEREQRADSIGRAMFKWLMDTSITKIYSKVHPDYPDKMVYYVEDAKAPKIQRTDFSLAFENRPVNNDSSKAVIARHVISIFLQSYRDFASVFYYTANLGDSASHLSYQLCSDTSRLKITLGQLLKEEGVLVNFRLKYVELNDSAIVKDLQSKASLSQSLQTKLFKSDSYDKGEPKYVYAEFDNPSGWVFRRLLSPILVCLAILLLFGGLMLFFYRTVQRQKRLSAMKNDFINNMTHELKTPIATISAAAESLQSFSNGNPSEKTGRYLKAIMDQSDRLNHIVDKVLDVSVFDNDELTLNKSVFSLREMLLSVQSAVLLLPQNREISIRLPEVDMLLNGDPFHLKNVIHNLTDNAIKYNFNTNKYVHIDSWESGESAFIAVSDNGAGMSEEVAKMAFEKFFREPSGNIHRVKGFGLGLYYVKKVIDRHGGEVSIESKPGVSTRVIITLPKSVMHE